ncbi:BZ3500_MvSof-1268-A1-R1_Chr6-2g08610 [Microbotryum saponariae]|uniref:BZ3500_MvSof-1268-A1-R1_Chr6-2g08610 protein n=1 Tax=Microbotryum saponariae TaxID=289078 RepID=A0A2X0NIT0_9BASI|nr:BZ3500_MvSof-1268-A1-R1_Chr6-2g08610 [Microbotryum saponariae]SDA07882.1 BZ3501_MvSof-1269-A2-R1_Chr6-1g08319 [Microbotryum saponariae]
MSNKVNILVYNGSGVSAASLAFTLASLKAYASHHYDVQLVSPKTLRSDPWTETCALLVFPGGRDLPYLFDLQGEPNRRIKEWVTKHGGKYLGFCAGAYYASQEIEFERGTRLEVVGQRELGFFPGMCKGAVFAGFEYDSEAGAREVSIALVRNVWRDHWSMSPEKLDVWYNGGGHFVLAEDSITSEQRSRIGILARYEQIEGRPIAGVVCDVGNKGGKAVLWSVHPEHPSLATNSSKASSSLDYDAKEALRSALLRSTLALLDIQVSEEAAPPPKLLPLFLASTDLELVTRTAIAIGSKRVAGQQSQATLEDRNDSFLLHPSKVASKVIHAHRARQGTFDVEELRTTTKEIVVCSEGLPPKEWTPLFDVRAYFEQKQALAAGSEGMGIGGILMYGETVTSTQTMMDKNDRFLSALPLGLTCIASHQIAGRGRGGNSWVSPAGCLQFSLVLRLASNQASKIVFLQYLFGLAVVEAIRGTPGYAGVEVCLKWPNDVYGRVGEGKELRKIGGILVNSSYAGDEFTLVVGCGINTSNPLPTTSVNELVAAHNAQYGTALAPFTPEVLMARVLHQFGGMWDVFLNEGFEPFVNRYLGCWIHSEQRVTIEATGQIVKIIGITPDHGLLRTVPIDVDREGREVFGGGMGREPRRGFVDLQPDGNGFDMLKKLLVSKKT